MKQPPVDRVRPIAVALMLLAATSILVLLLVLGWMVYLLVTGEETIAPILAFVVVSPWIATNAVIFVGALRMADLRNYRLAWWASLLSFLPFPGPLLCFPAGPIFGGIAIFYLLQPSVKQAFRNAEQDPETAFGNGLRRPLHRAITRTLLMLLVIAAAATVALTTSPDWWRGSSRVAWAAVAFVECVLVHVVVYRTLLREGLDPLVAFDDGMDDEWPSRSVQQGVVVGCYGFFMACLVAAVAALAAGLPRSEQRWDPSVPALVSICVLLSPFVAPFLSGGGGDGDDGDD